MIWNNIAYIYNGIIQDISSYNIELECDYDLEAKKYVSEKFNVSTDNTAYAINVNQYNVQIGDRYDGTNFLRYDKEMNDYTIIQYIPTLEEQIEKNTKELNLVKSKIFKIEEELHLLLVQE